jgi:hypothetical protein
LVLGCGIPPLRVWERVLWSTGLTLPLEQRGAGAACSDRELVAAAVIESLAGSNHGFQFSSGLYVGALLGRQRTRKSQTKAVQLMWISNEITVLLAKPGSFGRGLYI